eukprot:gene3284-3561_t
MSPATFFECDNDPQECYQGAVARTATFSGSRCGGWKAQAEVVVRRVKQAREMQALGVPQQLRGARYKPKQHKLLIGSVAANAHAEEITTGPCKAGNVAVAGACMSGTKLPAAAPKSIKLQRLKQQAMHSTAVLVPPALLYQALGPHTAAMLQMKHQAGVSTDTHTNLNSSAELCSSWELFAKQLTGGSGCWDGSPEASVAASSIAEDVLALTAGAMPAAVDLANSNQVPGLEQLSGCSAKLLSSRQVGRHDKHKPPISSSPAGLVPANETTGGNLWLSEVRAWAAQAKALKAGRRQQQRQRPTTSAHSVTSQQQGLQRGEAVARQPVGSSRTAGSTPTAPCAPAPPAEGVQLKAGQELSRLMVSPSLSFSSLTGTAASASDATGAAGAACEQDGGGPFDAEAADAAPFKCQDGDDDADGESAAQHLAAAVPAELWAYDEATGCYWLPLAAVAAAMAATDDGDTDVGTDFSSWCGDSVIAAALAAEDLQQQAQERHPEQQHVSQAPGGAGAVDGGGVDLDRALGEVDDWEEVE